MLREDLSMMTGDRHELTVIPGSGPGTGGAADLDSNLKILVPRLPAKMRQRIVDCAVEYKLAQQAYQAVLKDHGGARLMVARRFGDAAFELGEALDKAISWLRNQERLIIRPS
jgi:hypothetical protein